MLGALALAAVLDHEAGEPLDARAEERGRVELAEVTDRIGRIPGVKPALLQSLIAEVRRTGADERTIRTMLYRLRKRLDEANEHPARVVAVLKGTLDLIADVLIIFKRPHIPSAKESTAWVVFYALLAIAFGGVIAWLGNAEAARGGRRRAETNARRDERFFRIERNGVLVDGNAGLVERLHERAVTGGPDAGGDLPALQLGQRAV